MNKEELIKRLRKDKYIEDFEEHTKQRRECLIFYIDETLKKTNHPIAIKEIIRTREIVNTDSLYVNQSFNKMVEYKEILII